MRPTTCRHRSSARCPPRECRPADGADSRDRPRVQSRDPRDRAAPAVPIRRTATRACCKSVSSNWRCSNQRSTDCHRRKPRRRRVGRRRRGHGPVSLRRGRRGKALPRPRARHSAQTTSRRQPGRRRIEQCEQREQTRRGECRFAADVRAGLGCERPKRSNSAGRL